MAERDESSGLQAFKYGWAVGSSSTQRNPSASTLAGPAVTKPLPVGWVRQQRGALAAVPCAERAQIAVERWMRRTVVSTSPAAESS